MILRYFLATLLCLPAFALPTPLNPAQVVVVYNSNLEESKELAEFYALSRRIPANQIVGIPTTEKATIDRATYEKSIRNPLVKKFISEKWWEMAKDANGLLLPGKTRIRCLALMKGMPLRISRSPMPDGETSKTRRFNHQTEASLDSELSLMGVSSYPLGGPIPNPYFRQNYPAVRNPANYLLLVGRIDAKNYDQCKRMILDALDVESQGLWGRTYLDLANKGKGYTVGDQWIKNIAHSSIKAGIPTVVEAHSNTFTTNYPMTDAAVYFGWYTQHRNGPFLNEKMKFKKGAIAVHLHSFSAQQLTNPAKNWSAALIDRGAAATLGNTWEPYLQLSHQFDIFYDRLLQGYTLVEAGYMAIHALSWQNVVIGDPLYQPYKVTTIRKETLKTDRDYKILKYSLEKWTDASQRQTELLKAAENIKSGTIYEFMGFRSLELGNHEEANKAFTRAKELFTAPADKLRQSLNQVESLRRQKNTGRAIQLLRQAKKEFKELPEVRSVDGLLTILDPPAPPATKRRKKQ